MTQGPRISVIIPAYNAAAFLERTLVRVFRQQRPAHEVIIIDDGSTDETPRLLEKYMDKIIYKKIRNSGCSVARNEGVRLSSGDVLAFLDADDGWFSKKLKVFSEALTRFPQVGFFCSEYLVRSDVHRGIVRHYQHLANRRDFNFDQPLKNLPLKLLMVSNFVGTPSAAVIRRDLFDRLGGFDPECRIVEDLDLFLRAAMRTNFVVIGQPLFYKHNHEQSMSHDKIKTLEAHRRVLLGNVPDLRDYLSQHGLEGDLGLGLAGIDYALGAEYFDSGDKKTAFKRFREALGASRHPLNFLRYLWAVTKKIMRILSGDLLSKNKWRRWFRE